MVSATEQLLDCPAFEPKAETRRLFLESFRETAQKHYEGNAVFRAFWDDAGVQPADIQREDDLQKVPALMVHLFKERELWTGPRSAIELVLGSSGTGGQKSQIFLDGGSLARVKKLAYRIHQDLGIVSDRQYHYLCFTYDPKVAGDLGTAFTDELLTGFTQKGRVEYTFKWSEEKKDFVYDLEGTIAFLHWAQAQWREQGIPCRILGFPAFLYKLLKENHLQFELGPDSWVQTGGGWKGLAGEEIPKPAFRKFIAEHLGLPIENVRDLFGMVEHGIPYVDCAQGRLHIPEYARVYARSPDGKGILPEGQVGLLHFLCTYNQSYPAMSLLTTDWGRIERCDCGLDSPTIEILGRAGISKHKGCAVKAADLL